MRKTFRIYHPRFQEIREAIPDYFLINPQGKWPWLQKQLFKLLERLGAHTEKEGISRTIKIESVDLDFSRIDRHVMDLARDIWKTYYKNTIYLICGHEVFEAIYECGVKQSMYYPMTVQLDSHTGSRTFMGMQIILVPWFDGLLLLPDFKELR